MPSPTNSRKPVTARRLAFTATGLLAASAMLGLSPQVAREGSAVHREAMSAAEGTPFDASSLATLTEWVGGEPVTAEAMTKGDVVAIVFIDIANGTSMTVLNTLTRLIRTQGQQGLTVLAVHAEEEWDGITKLADANRIRVPVAMDAGGSFRKALGADDAPDVFMVDRAGQLRFADIETRSVSMAVSLLLRETPDDAMRNARAESATREALAAESPARPATEAKQKKNATPQDYAKAAWPSHNEGGLSGRNVQGSPLPVPLGSETWLTGEQDLTGKAIVLDFWATWCGPCIAASPTLDSLQRSHQGKLAVLAVGGQSEDMNTIKAYINRKPSAYGHLFDASQRVYKALQIRGIPHVVVMSTDGIVRWQGNPLSPDFRAAVEQVIRVDPGL
jgi:thiol-disulfide isomerase/thioredoxin